MYDEIRPFRTLVAGIGSPHGDDQAGWLVADRLTRELHRDDVAVRKATSPTELLNWLDGTERLIVCDACCGLGNAGDVRRWPWPHDELFNAAWSGTHDLPLPAAGSPPSALRSPLPGALSPSSVSQPPDFVGI